jgi:4-amino-4-deoxy-L-arabinose transferase-like glycosyltransferase
MSARTNWLLLALVLLASTFIQTTVVTRSESKGIFGADSADYLSYAYNLHYHATFSNERPYGEAEELRNPRPDNLRPPVYPLFLLALGTPEPTPDYLLRVGFAQALLAVASVWLVFAIGAQFLGRRWALLPAALTAILPHLAVQSSYLLSETLFMFLLLAGILATIRAWRSQRLWMWGLAGALWAACSLVRSTPLYLAPLVMLAALALPALRPMRRHLAVAFACFALVMSPWLLRNLSSAVDKPASNLMVKALMHGSYPDFTFEGRAETFGFPYRFDPQSDANSRDLPTVLAYIGSRFQAEPLRYLHWYLLGKPRYFLAWGNVQGWDIFVLEPVRSPYNESRLFYGLRKASEALHPWLMWLGVLGALLLLAPPRWHRLDEPAWRAAVVVAVVVAYALALHMVVAPFPRYGVPFRPLLFLLAMLPLRAMLLAWRRPQAEAA